MTDKQIIIDGIDVSECEFLIISNDKQLCHCIKSDLFGGIEFVENAKNGNCKDNPNCYYKQLARKERECQRTEQKLTLIRDFITDTQIYNMAHSVCDKILQVIDEV